MPRSRRSSDAAHHQLAEKYKRQDRERALIETYPELYERFVAGMDDIEGDEYVDRAIDAGENHFFRSIFALS